MNNKNTLEIYGNSSLLEGLNPNSTLLFIATHISGLEKEHLKSNFSLDDILSFKEEALEYIAESEVSTQDREKLNKNLEDYCKKLEGKIDNKFSSKIRKILKGIFN